MQMRLNYFRDSKKLSKYFVISFCSHVVLLGLFLLESGVENRSTTEHFYQANIVFETIPPIESTAKQNRSSLKRPEVYQPETNPLSTPNEYQKADLTFTTPNQNVKTSSESVKLSVKRNASDNNKSVTTRPILSISAPPPNEKLIAMKTPDFAGTALPHSATTEAVRYRETLTPTPKPKVIYDSRSKNRLENVKVEPSNSSTFKYPLTSHSLDKNTAIAGAATSAILRFNNELMPQLGLPKNVQFSANKMVRQEISDNLSLSLNPRTQTYQGRQQCKLIPKQTTKSELNIRKIQNQIKSRNITISNILTHKSLLKPSEISISSLLTSDRNTTTHHLQRPIDNIAFLLTTNSFQDFSKDVVCEPY